MSALLELVKTDDNSLQFKVIVLFYTPNMQIFALFMKKKVNKILYIYINFSSATRQKLNLQRSFFSLLPNFIPLTLFWYAIIYCSSIYCHWSIINGSYCPFHCIFNHQPCCCCPLQLPLTQQLLLYAFTGHHFSAIIYSSSF